jgi:FkbM family methyltransferase
VKLFELMQVFGLPTRSILHVGANMGQERFHYAASGARLCIYVEPIDQIFAILSQNLRELPGHYAVQALCSDVAGETIQFNIASNEGQSSSMFGLGEHALLHPEIVYTASQEMVTTTVDQLMTRLEPSDPSNVMVIDTQGADLKVLQGSIETLSHVDAIFVEISENAIYDGGCTHEQITAFLKPLGFRMRWMELNQFLWGDAFYCRPQSR